MAERHDVTRLLEEWSAGSDEAFDRLADIVYDDLRAIAHRQLRRERPGHTLDTSALVHESYMRLAGAPVDDWTDRAHFFAIASRVMRRVLIDHARARSAAKRGGDRVRVTLHERRDDSTVDLDELLALDEALVTLARTDERLVRVVECRFFGGMTVEETSRALEVSSRTIERDWVRARGYLYRLLDRGAPGDARA